MKRTFIRFAMALILALMLISADRPTTKQARGVRFLPEPLNDDWNNWLVGEWESTGDADTGKGRGTARIELGLNGQFRIHAEEGVITEMTPQQIQYLKRNLHATDDEIERFRKEPYRALEIYTIDQTTGEVVGYLFDSLRCIATGRGTRQGDVETVHWEWATGHKSTRITQKVNDDTIDVVQKTPMPDGSVMQEKGQAIRTKRSPAPKKP